MENSDNGRSANRGSTVNNCILRNYQRDFYILLLLLRKEENTCGIINRIKRIFLANIVFYKALAFKLHKSQYSVNTGMLYIEIKL